MSNRKLPMSELHQMKPVMWFLALAVWTGWLNFLGLSLGFAKNSGSILSYLTVVVMTLVLPFLEQPLIPLTNKWKFTLIGVGLVAGYAIQFWLIS